MSDTIYMHAPQVASLSTLAIELIGGGGAVFIENESGDLKITTDKGQTWRLLSDGKIVRESDG